MMVLHPEKQNGICNAVPPLRPPIVILQIVAHRL
jgi:hypothetical protein